MLSIKQELFIKSPLNYIGGKHKLLPQIFSLFPKNNNIALDLFCGGGNVGINLEAKKIILNDKLSILIDLFDLFKKLSYDEIFENIASIIKDFKLSNTSQYGYQFYECDSTKGLSKYNKDKFSNLKKHYNAKKDILILFVLILYSFNNQIRFNTKGEFNLPVGKRDFNLNMQKKLKSFINALQSKNIELQNKDFREFDISKLDTHSFVYIDPPYYLALATYNENNGWNKEDEFDLLEFLKMLDSKNIHFALSNVIYHKDKKHTILIDWLKSNPSFILHKLDFSYKNCNYQTKKSDSQEILITNY